MEVLGVGNTAYVDDDFCAKAFPRGPCAGRSRAGRAPRRVIAPCLVERAPPAPGSGL